LTTSGQRKRSILSRIVRRAIMTTYRLQGWTLEGHLPAIPKFVIAGAPHTSNWDFVFFIGATAQEGIEPNFMGKHTLFRGLMRDFMFDMGGIPIDRTKRSNYVDQVVDEFERRDRLALVIAVEGTRSTDGSWKSGFYHIARAANVPIVPTWVCNERRVLGFGPPVIATQSYAETLLTIARYMRSKLPELERFKVLEAQALALVKENGND